MLIPCGVMIPTPVASQTRSTVSSASIVRAVRPSVVLIRVYSANGKAIALGSGFVIEGNRIVTNRHVVAGGSRADVVDITNRLVSTIDHLDAVDLEADLAILPSASTFVSQLRLSHRNPAVGERILVFGAPEGLANTVTDGIVSAYRRVRGKELIQISAPISPGSSGGPVIDSYGEVVGVSVASLVEGQNLNFAVPVGDVRALASLPVGRHSFPPSEEKAEEPENTPAYQYAPPSGGYFFATKKDLRGRQITGSAFIIPQSGTYRIVGYWKEGPGSRNDPPNWFDSPAAFFPDGRAVITLFAPYEGGWTDRQTLALSRSGLARDSAAGQDALLVFRAEALRQLGALARPIGTYKVEGQSGLIQWTGFVGVVATVEEGDLGRTENAVVVVNIRSDRGEGLNLHLTGYWNEDGVLGLEPIKTRDGSTEVTGSVIGGQVQLKVSRPMRDQHGEYGRYHQIITLQGQKLTY